MQLNMYYLQILFMDDFRDSELHWYFVCLRACVLHIGNVCQPVSACTMLSSAHAQQAQLSHHICSGHMPLQNYWRMSF